MSGFKSYKIRDGVHIPSEKFKENWDSIFGKKPKKETMKKESKKTKFIVKKIKGIKFDVRNKGTCYVTMPTNAGELTVYIDAMDGLTDSPLVEGWIFGRKDKSFQVKPNKKATKEG